MIVQVNVKEVRDDMERRYRSVGVMSGLTFYDWVKKMFPKNLYAVEDLKMSGGVESRHAMLPVGSARGGCVPQTERGEVGSFPTVDPSSESGSSAPPAQPSKRILPVDVQPEPPLEIRTAGGEARESTKTANGGLTVGSRGGQKPFDRKAYMKKYMETYRQKSVVCPDCGHTFKELKRVKE